FSKGGRMTTPDERQISFDGAAGVWAMDLLQQIGRSGQIDMSRDQARQAFAAGVLGMYSNTSSLLSFFKEQGQGRFEVKMRPIPIVDLQGRLPAAGNAMVMFSRIPEKQQAAWEYIKFAAGPVGQSIMAKTSGYVPINEEAVATPELLGTFYAK